MWIATGSSHHERLSRILFLIVHNRILVNPNPHSNPARTGCELLAHGDLPGPGRPAPLRRPGCGPRLLPTSQVTTLVGREARDANSAPHARDYRWAVGSCLDRLGGDERRRKRRAAPSARHHGASTATPIKHLVVIFDENIVVRSLLRDLSLRPEPAGEPAFHAQARHADGQRPVQQRGPVWPDRAAAHQQPEPVEPAAARTGRPDDLRPGPRLHRRAAGRRPRRRGHVRGRTPGTRDPGPLPGRAEVPRQARTGTARRATRTSP